MDDTRRYLKLKCKECGDEYFQQERVYRIAKWKDKCGKCRKEIYKCPDCGKRIWRLSNKCSSCAKKLPKNFCIDCGIEITLHAVRCLKCHNKKQDKGISRDRTKFQNAKKWREVRKKCFIRDNYLCKVCGDKGKKNHAVEINAHHIKSWKDFSKLRLDVNNLITVCRKCHMAIHCELKREYPYA